MSNTPNLPQPRCKNLHCKSMLVYGENFMQDPDFQAGLNEFWCVRTSNAQGPDGDGLSLEMCSNPERTCYEAF